MGVILMLMTIGGSVVAAVLLIVSRITKRGLEILAALDEPMSDCIKGQLGHLSDKQLEQLNDLLVLARGRSNSAE